MVRTEGTWRTEGTSTFGLWRIESMGWPVPRARVLLGSVVKAGRYGLTRRHATHRIRNWVIDNYESLAHEEKRHDA